MNTAEMWLKAQNDGKIYECIGGGMAYSKKHGLVDKHDFNDSWGLEAWKYEGAKGIDKLLSCEWEEMENAEMENAMTIEEAEKRFGIKIILK